VRWALALTALALTACTSGTASTPRAGSGPSPAPAFFDPCPAAAAEVVGSGLPGVTLQCLGRGPKVKLSALRGPLVVNVWGSWCEPCQREVPALQAFYVKARGRVGLLGIDYNDTRGSAQDFAGHIGMTYPSVVAEEQDIRGRQPFVFSGLPMTVLVDADGKVVHVERTPFTKLSQLEQLVDQHLGVRL
jgi:thiol-disulfide isomerase/thioredoxin